MTEPTDPPKEGREIFRPYARLVSILGDQLISSKWVGVIELVKNSYDADAEKVSVRFVDFDEVGKEPFIEIEDDGDGMTLHIIREVWMKPATPYKLNQKKSKTNRFTNKGRLMQGDKGVGRFAIYKLGNHVEIFTKTAIGHWLHVVFLPIWWADLLDWRWFWPPSEFTGCWLIWSAKDRARSVSAWPWARSGATF